MREPPAPRLRPATAPDAADADFVYAVLDEAIGPYTRALEAWDEPENRARVARLLDTAETSVVTVAGEDIGYLSVWREPDEIYLASIALTRAWRGRGLGTALMRELIAEAAERRLPLRLSVLENNPARHLYARLGLAVTRTDGHKLRMELPPPPS